VYAYGPPGLGKSILVQNLVEMWCASEECEDVYVPYVTGAMNENRVRNIVDLEGPPVVVDEQDRESVGRLFKLLGSSTADVVGVHAARYGRGIGAKFKVRRAIFIVTNVPASDVLSRTDMAVRDAVRRRLLVVPWGEGRMDKETARRLIGELRRYTPPALTFVSVVYRRCADRLAQASDTLELAKTFWQCASETFGVDFSERVRALEWADAVQVGEKGQGGELRELWGAVKAHYRTSDDREAVLALLGDADVVVYTERGADERWNALLRAVCGQGVDSADYAEVFTAVAMCLYKLHIAPQEAEKVLGRTDVELLKKVVELKLAGRYPWVYAPSWLVPQKRRQVAGAPMVPDAARGVYRYDLFPQLFKMLFGEEQEEESVKGGDVVESTNVQGDVSLISLTPLTSLNGDSQKSDAISIGVEDGGDKSKGDFESAEDLVRDVREIREKLDSTNVSQTAALDTGKVENRKTSNTPSPPAVDVERVVEIVASELRRDPAEVRPVVEKALQYFDAFPSVGSIRAVEDLRRLARAEEKVVRAVLDVLVAVGALERAGGGAVYNYKPRVATWA